MVGMNVKQGSGCGQRPGDANGQRLAGCMDAVTVSTIDVTEALRVCEQFGAKPYTAPLASFGFQAVRNEKVVGALVFARQQFAPPGQIHLLVVRFRVAEGMKASHEARVRAALLRATPQMIADAEGESVAASIRVGLTHPDHAVAPREAGWVERPTCFTKRAWPSASRIAARWGEVV